MINDMETTRAYAPHELQPSTPIHPGEILKDELEARGMSQRKFAAVIGVSYSVLNEVVNGKRPITTEYALKIEAATERISFLFFCCCICDFLHLKNGVCGCRFVILFVALLNAGLEMMFVNKNGIKE